MARDLTEERRDRALPSGPERVGRVTPDAPQVAAGRPDERGPEPGEGPLPLDGVEHLDDPHVGRFGRARIALEPLPGPFREPPQIARPRGGRRWNRAESSTGSRRGPPPPWRRAPASGSGEVLRARRLPGFERIPPRRAPAGTEPGRYASTVPPDAGPRGVLSDGHARVGAPGGHVRAEGRGSGSGSRWPSCACTRSTKPSGPASRTLSEAARFLGEEYLDAFRRLGLLIDERAYVTTIDPDYQAFIGWQFRRLAEHGALVQSVHYSAVCPVCGPVSVDPSETDLSKGGDAEWITSPDRPVPLGGRAGAPGRHPAPRNDLRCHQSLGPSHRLPGRLAPRGGALPRQPTCRGAAGGPARRPYRP